MTNEKEIQKVLETFLDQEGRVTRLPAKESKKKLLCTAMNALFEENKIYTEQEVNARLLTKFSKQDYVEARRYFIQFGLLVRTSDGREYRKK